MAIIDVTGRFPLAPVWWRGIRSGPSDVTTYALHYIDDEGTVPGPDATQAEEIAYLDAIHRYHLAVGYGGFGYHLAAFASGRVYLCTPLNRLGANVLGKNHEVIGVLLVFTGHIVPPLSTRKAAAEGIAYSDDTYVGRSPLRPTRGHGELVGTSCPGDRAEEWVPNLRESEEDDMPTLKEITDALRPIVAEESKRAANAAATVTRRKIAEIRKALVGGMIPGVFIRFEGTTTVYLLEYAGGVFVRHRVRNMETFTGISGEGPVLVLKASQKAKIAEGPELPDLRA